MFNRTLTVSMSKPKKADKKVDAPAAPIAPSTFEQINELGKGAVGGVVLIVIAYVGMDTIRQVAVNASKTHL